MTDGRARLVTDEEVDQAIDYLRTSAAGVGEARRHLVLAEHMLKHVEALLFLASTEKTVDAKKADVRTQQKWLDAVQEEARAAGEYEQLRALREAAIARIDAWRTEQATMRGLRA